MVQSRGAVLIQKIKQDKNGNIGKNIRDKERAGDKLRGAVEIGARNADRGLDGA